MRFSQPQLATAKEVSRNTDVLIKSISAYITSKARKVSKAEEAITSKMRRANECPSESDPVADVEIQCFQEEQKKFDTLSMNIYWFTNSMAEKQRQTYGVYPFFPKK